VTATAPVLPGCEPLSHASDAGVGVLVVHGFTGSPFSVRGIADAMVAARYDVELPRLPGHGTTVAEMVSTRWSDWAAEVAAARERLARRVDRVVLVGQSMGATLILASALDDATVDGIVCVNPLTRPRTPEEIEMIDELLEDGFEIAPGTGSDIADPESHDVTYDGTPLAPIRSLVLEGVAPISDRFGELTMPLRMFSSRVDHVVDPGDGDHLAATWGGPVERTWLERSYHVATRDYDRDVVESGAVQFVRMVTAR
jgi:carboxylesterase